LMQETYVRHPTKAPTSHRVWDLPKLLETLARSPIVYSARSEYNSDESVKLRRTSSGKRRKAGSFEARKGASPCGTAIALSTGSFFEGIVRADWEIEVWPQKYVLLGYLLRLGEVVYSTRGVVMS